MWQMATKLLSDKLDKLRGKEKEKTKPKSKSKSKKKDYVMMYKTGKELADADLTIANKGGAKAEKKNTRLSADDYEEAAGYLGDFQIKVRDRIIKERLNDLIEKFKARAKKMRETTRTPGATHQKTQAQKYRCKKCNHEFTKPNKKLHCPNPECDSTDLEQTKLTDFRTEDAEIAEVTARL
jgi:rubrerythrin